MIWNGRFAESIVWSDVELIRTLQPFWRKIPKRSLVKFCEVLGFFQIFWKICSWISPRIRLAKSRLFSSSSRSWYSPMCSTVWVSSSSPFNDRDPFIKIVQLLSCLTVISVQLLEIPNQRCTDWRGSPQTKRCFSSEYLWMLLYTYI